MEARQIRPMSSVTNTIVVETEQSEYRYFNGRKYYVNRSLEHYFRVSERHSFWIHTTYVLPSGKRRSTRLSRISSNTY
jgi:hypothetical protein